MKDRRAVGRPGNPGQMGEYSSNLKYFRGEGFAFIPAKMGEGTIVPRPVPPVPTALNKRAGCLHFFTMQFCWHFHCQPIDKSTKSKGKKIS